MRGLEQIVSEAFDSVARIEDRIVNSAYASGFAINHPVAAGIIGSAGLLGAVSYLYWVIAPYSVPLNVQSISTLAVPVAVIWSGLWLYNLARQHKEVKDAGLPVEKFYELSSQKAYKHQDGKGLTGIVGKFWHAICQHPRRTGLFLSASGLAALNYNSYHLGVPLELLAKMDVVAMPALYICGRGVMNGFRPISNAASFKVAIIESLAFIASKATGNKRINLRAMEMIARDAPSALASIELSDAYFDAGMIDEGLLQAKEAIGQEAYLPASFAPVAAVKRIGAAAKAHKAIRTGTATPKDYVEFSRACQYVGETTKAWQKIEEMTRKFPRIESDILAAMLLESEGNTEKAAVHWNAATHAIISDPKTKASHMSDPGVHHVWTPVSTPTITGTFAFKPFQNYNYLMFERDAIAYVKPLPRPSIIEFPVVIAEPVHRNGGTTYYLVLRYRKGKQIPEMQKDGTLREDNLVSAIESMVWLHSTVPPELSVKGKVDLHEKLRQRLLNPCFGLPEYLAKSMMANFSPIIERQNTSPFVFAGDFFTSKLIFYDKIMLVDWEDKGVTTLFEDAAKFYMDPGMVLEDDTLFKLNRHAAASYNAIGLSKSDYDFMPLQLEAMLAQAIFSASIWSDPEMSHKRDYRPLVIDGTARTFRMIKSNHGSHYSLNKLSYDRLESDFMRVREMLEAN